MIKNIAISLLLLHMTLQADFYYSGGKKYILKQIKSNRAASKNSEHIYKTKNGTILKSNHNIILSLSDIKRKKEIEKKYNLTFVKSLTDKIFVYSVKDISKTIQTANSIYRESGVEFCHPDFKINKKTRAITDDPYSYDAWHLRDEYYENADINIEQAWRYSKGEGVKVAVYDKGIDIDHPDLKDNIFAFENFNDPNSTIPYSDDDKNWHGTACAGILAASENHIGSVGVAPKVSLYAVGYSENDISKDIEAYLWLMKEGVSIINNSWGSYENLDAYTAIFKELATNGRDGKGVIIVFAAGNESQNLDENSINDESESPFVLSISAHTRDNRIANYANYGSAIDFTAPGGGGQGDGIFTTDAQGDLGYSSWDYNTDFSGTSAAAPMVSGTIALMLGTNPKLTRNDVVEILKFTTDKEGIYKYDENGRNDHWGYGKINAGKAVALSKDYGKSKLKNFAHLMFMDQY